MQSEETSFDRYVQEIATPGTWSGALELSAYCENTATEAWVVSGLRAAELKGWLRVQLKGVWGFSRISCVSTQLAASVWPKAKGRHKRLHT